MYTDAKLFYVKEDTEVKLVNKGYKISAETVSLIYNFLHTPKAVDAHNFFICIIVCHSAITS